MIAISQIRASAISEKRATRTLPREYGVQEMKDETDSADRIPLAFLLGWAKYRASGAILSTRQNLHER